jgi:clan AA aspartic protease
MIEGIIQDDGSPVLTLRVSGRRQDVTMHSILDTGFEGFLCFPTPVAVTLGLELIGVTSSELADGTIRENDPVFEGNVEWDGALMRVPILLTDSQDPLIGTAFLEGYRVQLDYPARTVQIERVSTS